MRQSDAQRPPWCPALCGLEAGSAVVCAIVQANCAGDMHSRGGSASPQARGWGGMHLRDIGEADPEDRRPCGEDRKLRERTVETERLGERDNLQR